MNRVYLLNMPLNGAEFTLYGKGGNGVVYKFKGGNVTTKTPAYFMTSDAYYQQLLESSEIFAQGKVKFDPMTAKAVAEENRRKAEEALLKAQEAENEPEGDASGTVADMKIEEDVTSVTEAINYVAEKWGEVAKNAKQAKAIANSFGVDFPNLKVGKAK